MASQRPERVHVQRVGETPPIGDAPASTGSPGGFWPAALPPPSSRNAAIGVAVAVVSDLLSFVFAFLPPAQLAVDIPTALILWWLLGARWPLLPALIAESIPGLQLFPTWTMVAGAYWWYSRRRK